MANVHFLRKIASDELRDTLFFATGIRAEKVRTRNDIVLSANGFSIKIKSHKNIKVNGVQCNSISNAKYLICDSW